MKRAVLTVVLVALVIVELYLFTGFLPTRWQVAINDTLCRILPQTYDPFSRHASCHRPRNRTGNERAHRVEIDCVDSLYWDAAGEHVLNSLGVAASAAVFTNSQQAACMRRPALPWRQLGRLAVVNRRYHNLAPFVRQIGERKAQTCAKAISRQLNILNAFPGHRVTPNRA